MDRYTLRELAILHAQDKISDEDVTRELANISKVTEHRENGETWFTGNSENTITSVQALIGDEITQEDFDNFALLL